MKLSLTLTALAVALLGIAPDAALAGRCSGKRPAKLTFKRQAGQLVGRLSWRAPAGARRRRLGYRVYRNGAVVGQTRRRSMAIRTVPGHRYRFAVAPVLRSGRASRCAGRLRKRLSYYAPGAPGRLAASQVGDTGATLSWMASRRGDARVAGYRIYRDGRALRQVDGLSAAVELRPGSSHVFVVRAADGRGSLSRPSPSVRITVGHRAPTVPTALTASAVSDSEVSLSWSPSDATSGSIAGYRIYRNGVLLRQVRTLSAQVGNLAAATRYGFTVAAVDSSGYLSARSAPAYATTAMPPPTQGRVHAFMLATTDQSFTDLQAHYRQVGTVYPTYYDCRADGAITGVDDPLVTRWAQLRRIQVLPRFNCQRGSTLHLILTDPAVRSATLDGLVRLVEDHGYDGLNLDFESGAASDRDALTSYVSELASRLHAMGKRLSVEVSAKTSNTTTGRSGFYDYPALGQAADTVFVMNWGLHWSTSAPGAIDDLAWATRVADYVATMPTKSRFVLGAPLYGMDWADGGGSANPAEALEYADVRHRAEQWGATPELDPTTYSWHYTYVDGFGRSHDVWYSDALTVAARVRLARDRGLGIGFWRLGREDQGLWADELLAPGVPWS